MLLKAGQFKATYDNGFLRYVEVAGNEVIRMICFAVRDRDWNTIPGTITHVTIHQTDHSFKIQYRLDVKQGDIQMEWQVEMEGLPDSTIHFDIRGKVLHTFLRNRVGICVLHPVEGISGKPCLIGHPDGSITQSRFPAHIIPYQPFKNIRFMQWQSGSATLRLDFEGDVFETEDHRNWTDASYKTYCTPLDLPFPVEVKAGTLIHQSCTVRLFQSPTQVAIDQADRLIDIKIFNNTTPFPALGLGMNANGDDLADSEIKWLKDVHFSHLRADLFLTQANWPQVLQKSIEQSTLLATPLELAIFFGDHPQADVLQLLALITHHTGRIKQLLVFNAVTRLTDTALLKKVVPAIRLALPGCTIGGGTDANFAELNRHAFDYSLVDFVSFSINPQVHASDELTIVESIAAQADVVHCARRVAAGKPVCISPVTLKPRFNAVATSGHTSAAPPADYRQPTDFIAGWTLGSIKYLSEAGASAITYYETTGHRGICSEARAFPVGKLLAYIQNIRPQRVYHTTSSKPLLVSSLLLEAENGKYLLLANHTNQLQQVQLPETISLRSAANVIDRIEKTEAIQNHLISLHALDILGLELA